MTATANPRQAEVWNGSVGLHWAAHTDRYERLISGADEGLFGAADIAAGDRVLDVGCGAGATTRTAARLAAAGHVVGVDVSAPLLDRARERTVAEGITNAAYELGDAQVHPFPDAGFDVVISRGGVMFFADHAAAFRNLRRALRPGGRLVFICPQPSGPQWEESRALYLFSQLVSGPDGSREPDTVAAATAMASLSDPDRIHEVLDGFDDVRVAPFTIETEWGRDARDAVDFLLSRSPDTVVGPDGRARLEDALRPYARPDGVRMRAGVWLVSAVRP